MWTTKVIPPPSCLQRVSVSRFLVTKSCPTTFLVLVSCTPSVGRSKKHQTLLTWTFVLTPHPPGLTGNDHQYHPPGRLRGLSGSSCVGFPLLPLLTGSRSSSIEILDWMIAILGSGSNVPRQRKFWYGQNHLSSVLQKGSMRKSSLSTVSSCGDVWSRYKICSIGIGYTSYCYAWMIPAPRWNRPLSLGIAAYRWFSKKWTRTMSKKKPSLLHYTYFKTWKAPKIPSTADSGGCE